jgi:hypothetical protein
MEAPTAALIIDAVFRLLDLAIRTQTNRHGDQEEYITLRRKLRKQLLREAEGVADPDKAPGVLQHVEVPLLTDDETPSPSAPKPTEATMGAITDAQNGSGPEKSTE